MATIRNIDAQLKQIGCNFKYWGRAELKELANILLPGETINHCINGMYEGGFAMLCATDQRVLLIDKKPMYLTIEDIRFDMIAELDYNHRLLNASTLICTPNKSLRFTAYNHARLRNFYLYVQQRVMDIRQHYMQQMQMNEQVMASPPQQQQQPQPQFSSATPEQQPAPQASFSTPYLETQTVQQQAPAEQIAPQAPRRHMMVAPIISAYTRLPLMSRQRRFLGSSAVRSAAASRPVPLWQQR